MDGDDGVVAVADVVRAGCFCFVLARTMSLDQIRRLFVPKAVGKHHSGPGDAAAISSSPIRIQLWVGIRVSCPETPVVLDSNQNGQALENSS